MDEDEEMLNDHLNDIVDWLQEQALMQQASTSNIFEEETTPHLPPEVWERVFLHLQAPNELLSVRLVCHHWRNIVDRCPSLITKIKLKFPRKLTVDERYIPDSPFPARRVQFSISDIKTLDPWWPSVGQRLTELHLYCCIVAFPALIGMLRETPNLRWFSMISGGCTDLRNESVVVDFRLDRLERLKLEWSSHSSEPDVVDFFRRVSPRLKAFKFSRPMRLAGLEERVIQLVSDVQETLESLELSVLSSHTFLKTLSAMERLHLKVVILSGKDFMVDHQALVEFCRAQPTIEVLQMNYYEVTNEMLCAIGEALPVLKDLKVIVHFTNEGVTVVPTFLNAMPGLQRLSLSVTNKYQLIDFGPCRVPNLKELNLFMNRPTAEGLRQFFITSANIRKLSLNRCRLNSWSDIFTSARLKYLQKLELLEPIFANDQPELVLERLDNLKYLKFSSCRSSKSQIIKILSLCPSLERISLRGMIIDDEVTLVMCRQLSQLMRITLNNCAIGDISMEHIYWYCRMLNEIEIYNCRSLTDASVRILQSMENIKIKIRK